MTQVCHQILTILSGEQLAEPTANWWLLIAEGFKQRAKFSNCNGCVDGKQKRIAKIPKSGTMNFNYKGYFTIVLLAVVDSNYRFVYVDIGSNGKDCDSGIFHRTNCQPTNLYFFCFLFFHFTLLFVLVLYAYFIYQTIFFFATF